MGDVRESPRGEPWTGAWYAPWGIQAESIILEM